jgi:hypothetical protein
MSREELYAVICVGDAARARDVLTDQIVTP